mgnify:CR=1 FL=1
MTDRPVGMLDSGLGGISVLAQALRDLPREDYVYFGDTANIPYGDKDPSEVMRLTRLGVDKLMAHGCKAIVIACNTATSVAAEQLRKELSIPVIGIEPALKPASLLPGEGQILVLATQVTLRLPKFHALMERYGSNAVPVPCSGLMECVESGQLEGERVDALLRSYLAPYLDKPIKAVVLGCTHYPFLRKAIAALLPPGTPLVDGNAGTVRQLGRRLAEEALLAPPEHTGGKVTFLTSSRDPATLRHMQCMLETAMAML